MKIAVLPGDGIGKEIVAYAVTPRGDVHHWRAILECPRPSCPYDAQLRGPEFHAKVKEALAAMAQAGVKVVTVTRPDAPTGWSVIH